LAQYHPEFKSRPSKPAPLFMGLMRAAGKQAAARKAAAAAAVEALEVAEAAAVAAAAAAEAFDVDAAAAEALLNCSPDVAPAF
jgi:hypothetical protein